ncbi:MAG: ABC transporter permease [Mollicutes bacterium]|nr:ABC transporter permease [Mollicutes bacterium]
MKNIFKVFLFEFKTMLKTKAFKITTALILLITFGITFIPRFTGGLEDNKNFLDKTPDEQIEEIGKFGYVILDDTVLKEDLVKYFPFNLGEEYESEEKIKESIEKEVIKSGAVIIKQNEYKLLKAGSDFMFNETIKALLEEGMLKYNQDRFYLENNIDPNLVEEANNILIKSDIEEVGKSAQSNYFIAYFGIFILYFMIIMYGVSVSTSVAREKNDRTMELLITNTSATSLIVGKVIASLVLSFGQIILMILVGYLGFMINKGTYPAILLSILNQNITLNLLIVYLSFAIVGALLYFFVYAALGSLVTRVEDATSSMGPIQMIFVLAFLVAMYGMMNPTGKLLTYGSIFPLTSPMSMFARYSMSEVGTLEVIGSFILLLLTTILFAYISIKIYRMATLNYGNKMNLITALKHLKKEKKKSRIF